MKGKQLLFIGLLAYAIVYLLTLPSNWIITDSYSYVNQGYAIANGSYSYIWTDPISENDVSFWGTNYALGNAHWLALFIFLLGIKHVFVASLASTLITFYFLYKLIKLQQFNLIGLFSLGLFLPFHLFSKSLMSGLVSMALVSVFIYMLFSLQESKRKWFFLSMLATASFWFREYNIILLGGICLFHFMIERKYFFYYAVGAIIGLLPRLVSSYVVFDDPFFYVLSESIKLSNIYTNWLYYGISTLVLIPGGVYFLIKYKGQYRIEIIASTLLFVLFYGLYEYTPIPYSGFLKGMLLLERFLLPILPIFVLVTAYFFRKETILKETILMPVFFLLVIGLQTIIYFNLTKRENDAIAFLQDVRQERFMMYDMENSTPIGRYINPLTLKLDNSTTIRNITDSVYMEKLLGRYQSIFVPISENHQGVEKSKLSNNISELIDKAKLKYEVKPGPSHKIEEGLFIKTFEVEKKERFQK